MGHTTSKVESWSSKNEDAKARRDGSDVRCAGGHRPPVVVAKRRPIVVRPRFEDCFGLDESQSRSTESTQGSPDMDMYPSHNSTTTTRRNSTGTAVADATSTLGHHPTPLRWLRRQLSGATPGGGGTHYHTSTSGAATVTARNKALLSKTSLHDDCALPSYLEFPHLTTDKDSQEEEGLCISSYMPSRTAPMPVGRQTATNSSTLGTTAIATTGSGIATRKDSSSEHDVDRMDELQRMYDLRTWDMYLRITEARKKSTTAQGPSSHTMIPHSRPATDHAYAHTGYDYYVPAGGEELMEPSEQSRLDVSQSEDMIFGDLE